MEQKLVDYFIQRTDKNIEKLDKKVDGLKLAIDKLLLKDARTIGAATAISAIVAALIQVCAIYFSH